MQHVVKPVGSVCVWRRYLVAFRERLKSASKVAPSNMVVFRALRCHCGAFFAAACSTVPLCRIEPIHTSLLAGSCRVKVQNES